MDKGKLCTINGGIYEYVGYDEKSKNHIFSEVQIDDEGHLTQTHIRHGFSIEEFVETGSQGNFTKAQWCGIVEHFLRQDYSFSDEDIDTIVDDIVCRCFAYGIPKIEDLPQYIAEYLDR